MMVISWLRRKMEDGFKRIVSGFPKNSYEDLIQRLLTSLFSSVV